MIGLEIKFLAGRFHATPWGQHVNEGAVEWPPSPWRILRALLSAWHRKAYDIPEETVQSLINKLTEPPKFHLPAASLGHTRYYMPAPDTATKVFDAFVSLNKEESVKVIWPEVNLTPDENAALQRLTENISYLGRAESWVAISVMENGNGKFNSFPKSQTGNSSYEVQKLLVPRKPEEYDAWITHYKTDKKTKEKLPVNLFESLYTETATLQKEGWLIPPGAKWLDYVRPKESFKIIYTRKTKDDWMKPTVARFAIHGKPLPLLTDTIWLAEKIRQALMSKSKGLDGSEHALSIFSGRSPDGKPLSNNHQHAFYLPTDDDNDGRLDHITVYASQGFDDLAIQALTQLKRIWYPQGELNLILIGLGQADNYGGLESGRTPQLARSTTWLSRTPFMLTRHPKEYRDGRPKLNTQGTQIDGPQDQLYRELLNQGFPQPIQIQHIEYTRAAGKKIHWLKFKRQRSTGKQTNPFGYGFLIVFKEPVQGPIALGYACHYGLGQFIAVPLKD